MSNSVWIKLLDLSLKLLGRDNILKIVSETSKSLFLNEWTESSTRMRFVLACMLIDTKQTIYPGTKAWIKNEVVWQEFIYES